MQQKETGQVKKKGKKKRENELVCSVATLLIFHFTRASILNRLLFILQLKKEKEFICSIATLQHRYLHISHSLFPCFYIRTCLTLYSIFIRVIVYIFFFVLFCFNVRISNGAKKVDISKNSAKRFI